MDLCLYGFDHSLDAITIAAAANPTEAQVQQIWRDIAAKRNVTKYLHVVPLLIAPVVELTPA